MKRSRLLPIALVLGLVPALGGCVAALIPLAAGGAFAGKDRIGLGSNSEEVVAAEPEKTPEPEVEPDPVVTVAPQDDPPPQDDLLAQDSAPSEPDNKTEFVTIDPAPTDSGPTDPEAAQAEPQKEPVGLSGVEALSFNLADIRATEAAAAIPIEPGIDGLNEAEVTSVPEQASVLIKEAPSPAPNPAAAKPVSSYRGLSEIFAYVDNQAKRDPILEPRVSAILAAPGSLSPDRSDCSIRPLAVVLDLDPTESEFDPAIEAKTYPALAQMLRSFRMQEIEIFWISELAAVQARKVRNRLIESGLDPIGRDGLLLMRRAEDTKQARRRDLSETHCVVAIAGDAKSDFDELYDYLKDPSAAEPLDELLGSGWFLTPLPLPVSSIPEGQ